MDDYTELFDTFVENFSEITENKTKKPHIKLQIIKHLLDDIKKKCITICNDKLETLTKTKTLNPVQSFIKTHFKEITKEDKEQYNFNGLQGYKKFEKNIKYLINENEIDINDDDFNINEILEDLSQLIIDNKEDNNESTTKSTKQPKSIKTNKSSKKNVKIESDTEDNNNNETESENEHIDCKTEYFSENSDDDNIEEDIPPPPKNITKTEKSKKKNKKNKD